MHMLKIVGRRHASREGRFLLVIVVFACLAALAPAPALAAGPVAQPVLNPPPPATLGPYRMIPFPEDPRRADFTPVTSVPGPTGDILFSRTGYHDRVGDDWPLWGHEYRGDVYHFRGNAVPYGGTFETSVTITLPAGTIAFYMNVNTELARPGAVAHVTTGASAAAAEVRPLKGMDSVLVTIYSLDEPLDSVTVTVSGPSLAIGEFGICGAPTGNPRADVAVVIYGGWSGMPVQAWVGGTPQPVQYTAPDASGEAATLFTFWPAPGEAWPLTIAPQLPAELDPTRWEIRPVGISRRGVWREASDWTGLTVTGGAEIVLYFQLIDRGIQPSVYTTCTGGER